MQLQRRGDGLKIRLGVRPFGAGGPFYLAGQGGASVLVSVNGQRQRVNRDLDAEKEAVIALMRACPAMLAWGISDGECEIEALEDVLESLAQVQGYAQPVTFEWPEGEALKVSHTVTAQKLSIKLMQKRDWFEVSGKIEVDDGPHRRYAGGADAPGPGARPVRSARWRPVHRADRKICSASFAAWKASPSKRPEAAACMALASMAVEDLVESAGKVQADKHWRELSARIRAAGSHTPKVPATLQAELRDYQAEGFAWLSRLANLQMGACLADDMGLGKTVQTIAAMLEQQARGACLVVAPTSVCHNWESELARFAPTLNATVSPRRSRPRQPDRSHGTRATCSSPAMACCTRRTKR